MQKKVFVGFGFGAIQSGLFLYEAHQSGAFDRLVVVEILPEVVSALRRSGGCYHVNVATDRCVDIHKVRNIEIFNPTDPADRDALLEALVEATEMATALPSVDFFARGNPSVASLLAQGLEGKLRTPGAPPCVLYAAENHNHAAEILEATVRERMQPALASRLDTVFQSLNTVIGKMSKVVTSGLEIEEAHLAAVTPDLPRAFLVEEFNRILISRVTLPGFVRGIGVFEEKNDLLPFEEAKLYGHNAVHALIGFLANQKGYRYMSDAAGDTALMKTAREAFLEESGPALMARHGGHDPLFTPERYRDYADDLLKRMVNPWLRDAVERVIRDPRRKLGWDDRLVGTMRLAMDAGIVPVRFARAAAAARALVMSEAEGSSTSGNDLLGSLWTVPDVPAGRKAALQKLIQMADV